MVALRPAAYHLSPAIGLAIGAGGAHLLSNLYAVRDDLGGGSASAMLTRELFHRTHPQERERLHCTHTARTLHARYSSTVHCVFYRPTHLSRCSLHRSRP